MIVSANHKEDIQQAKWAALQELNDDDIMDAIQGSIAIPLAIKHGDWNEALALVKQRVTTKIARLAELSVYGDAKTPWICDAEEVNELRVLWLLREKKSLERKL
jgi:hypothetical protein